MSKKLITVLSFFGAIVFLLLLADVLLRSIIGVNIWNCFDYSSGICTGSHENDFLNAECPTGEKASIALGVTGEVTGQICYKPAADSGKDCLDSIDCESGSCLLINNEEALNCIENADTRQYYSGINCPGVTGKCSDGSDKYIGGTYLEKGKIIQPVY